MCPGKCWRCIQAEHWMLNTKVPACSNFSPQQVFKSGHCITRCKLCKYVVRASPLSSTSSFTFFIVKIFIEQDSSSLILHSWAATKMLGGGRSVIGGILHGWLASFPPALCPVSSHHKMLSRSAFSPTSARINHDTLQSGSSPTLVSPRISRSNIWNNPSARCKLSSLRRHRLCADPWPRFLRCVSWCRLQAPPFLSASLFSHLKLSHARPSAADLKHMQL